MARFVPVILMLGTFLEARAECPKVEPTKRPYRGTLPVGGSYLRAEPGFLSPAQQHAREAMRTLWSDPGTEPGGTVKNSVVFVADALWREALAVAQTGQKIGLCPPGCKLITTQLRRITKWYSTDLEELVLTRTAYGTRGYISRFEKGGVRWDVRCEHEGDDWYPVCVATLAKGMQSIATYAPGSAWGGGGWSQRLHVACGMLGFQSDEDEDRVEISRFGTRLSPLTGRVAPETTRASSQLKGPYGAGLATDGRVATAWAEGAPGQGEGQWIELKWSKPQPVSTLAVFPGYGKSRALFRANARIKRARLVFSNGRSFEVSFDDLPVLQERLTFKKIPGLRPEAWEEPVTSMRMEILEVYPGAKHADACVSEILLF